MDEAGNIIVKRLSNCDVFIRGWNKNNNSLSSEIIQLNGELELDKSVNLFDMNKFQASVNRQLKSPYPNRRELENQCICAIVFVKDCHSLLDSSSWILLINIVALDLLKCRLPPVCYASRNIQLPSSLKTASSRFISSGYHSRSPSDEDPYSILLPSTHSSSTNSSDDKNNNKKGRLSSNSSSESVSDHKPPELPPRDFTKSNKKSKSAHSLVASGIRSLMKSNSNGKINQLALSTVPVDNSWGKYFIFFFFICLRSPCYLFSSSENPYYCGMEARVSKFTGKDKINPRKKTASDLIARKSAAAAAAAAASIYYEERHEKPIAVSMAEMKKSHSNGYLNTLFSQSSNLFTGKKIREQNKKIDSNTNGLFYHTSLGT